MIADVFIKRPVTAIVISLVLLMVGTICILNLPVGQYPEITPATVQVTGQFTGADALTVEQTMATPVEAQINGTPGMNYLQSNSTSNGAMTVNVIFGIGTNIDVATLDVQNRVSIATPQLPDVVKRLGLTVRKRNPSILMLVALYSPKGSHNVTFVDNYTNIFVRDALLRVKGVGDIFSRTDDFSMRVWLKPDKLAEYGLSASDVTSALSEQNVQVAAGSVGVPPQQSTQVFEYSLMVNGRLNKVADFENIIIKTVPGTGQLLYLKDVARVELGKFAYASNSFVDGKRASYLLVYQAPGSNALETAEGVYAKLAEMKKTFPGDIDYSVPFESVTVVKVSMHEVVLTLLEALGLVAIVVFLFLQNWRATLIPILAIPVSIIGTFIFFIPLGFTINTLTMFGFILAIGIVVDDAIVVVEAVQHYMDHKDMSAREATTQAMKDISGPVIAIALILAAVFVPVGFIPGIVGRLYQQFAVTIAISVILSAFVALSLTPALCILLLKKSTVNKEARGLNGLFYKFNNWFERFSDRYTSGVKHSIKASKLVIIILVCICAGTVLLFKAKPTGFIPTEDEGRIFITYELPEASSTARSLEVMQKVMKAVGETPGVGHYAALGGLNVVTFSTKSNSGSIFCQLKPWDERTKADEQVPNIIDVLKQRIAAAGVKQANVVVISPPPIPGLGQTAGFAMQIQQRETPDDVRAFEKVVKNFVAEVQKDPAIGNAFSFYGAHTPSYSLTVDREKCKKMGVSISEVFSAIQTYMGSFYVNDISLYSRNFHVMVQADTNYRVNITDLDKYYVKNQAGQMLPMSTLVTYAPIETAPLISHFNIFRSAEVDGTPKKGYSSGQALDALKKVAAKTLPNGYGYEFSGLSYEEEKAGNSSIYIFMLSIVFVFLFLAALYESWSVPFSVLFAVPVGAFGAILTLTFVPSLTDNVYAQIGLITLIGLSAKNAILIVEFAKERVDSGEELIRSTLEAVRLRLRPIIMTSLAFILGVMPLVLAEGAGAVARRTIGFTVFGGMLAATSLAIFIVPVLFVVICRISYGKKALERKEKGEGTGVDEVIVN
ncbi:hydrophobe/amphiphile efflux-1 family RND transporter [Flavipsychrobacter stenotrophus]|uniref:Hydrophobe/amphiphile efflux-1 family RND transporter n=1 Tax=Flavipsychrobacter stenotrophus TaxID=2077091 RepID=A0A2S7STL1_9BACT|nr:efflux RND transporter permease subunit [Flavipsychrobacter stenotrophus]PQJ09856.1 hydrophobe/amphiphile efflux-1 family RND transporter [Flavipsychrobacter stenotrophus]